MRLNQLGFDWGTRPEMSNMDWDEMYMELLKFHVKEGHSNVPSSYVTPGQGGKPLGRWLTYQRDYPPTDERKNKLDLLAGMNGQVCEWVGGDAASVNITHHASRVTPPVEPYPSTPPSLHPSLPSSHPFPALNPQDWDKNFEALRQYVNREGHARVPKSYRAPDGTALGLWVDAQRHIQLPPERKSKLETLNFPWHVSHDEMWEESHKVSCPHRIQI